MGLSLASMKSSISDTDDLELNFEEATVNTDEDILSRTGMTNANDFQIDIFKEFSNQIDNYINGDPTSSIAVRAVAGSGKSTTIKAAANLIPKNLDTVFLAFNKSIAEELREKLPNHVDSKTLNQLGYGILRQHLRQIGVSRNTVSSNRTFGIIRKEMSYQEKDDMGQHVGFLVGMCKALGVVPVGLNPDTGVGVEGKTATDEVLTKICYHHGHMVNPIIRPTVYQKVRDILAISFNDSNIYETGVVDFDDQKWFPVCKRVNGRPIAVPKYDDSGYAVVGEGAGTSSVGNRSQYCRFHRTKSFHAKGRQSAYFRLQCCIVGVLVLL